MFLPLRGVYPCHWRSFNNPQAFQEAKVFPNRGDLPCSGNPSQAFPRKGSQIFQDIHLPHICHTGDSNIDTGGEFLRCLQGSKEGAPSLRMRRPRQPFPQPYHIESRSGGYML